MKTKTSVKIFFIVFFILLSLAIGAEYGGEYFQSLLIFSPIIIPFFISVINDFERDKIQKKNISLTRKILTVVNSNPKPLSIYDFMLRIQENEDIIEEELENFVKKGLAEKIINEKGLILYRFFMIPSEEERKDII